jgi:hypothetical protein
VVGGLQSTRWYDDFVPRVLIAVVLIVAWALAGPVGAAFEPCQAEPLTCEVLCGATVDITPVSSQEPRFGAGDPVWSASCPALPPITLTSADPPPKIAPAPTRS